MLVSPSLPHRHSMLEWPNSPQPSLLLYRHSPEVFTGFLVLTKIQYTLFHIHTAHDSTIFIFIRRISSDPTYQEIFGLYLQHRSRIQHHLPSPPLLVPPQSKPLPSHRDSCSPSRPLPPPESRQTLPWTPSLLRTSTTYSHTTLHYLWACPLF